jgi:hypothetical protein
VSAVWRKNSDVHDTLLPKAHCPLHPSSEEAEETRSSLLLLLLLLLLPPESVEGWRRANGL